MTRERHIILHQALDELLAAFVQERLEIYAPGNPLAFLDAPIRELMEWSSAQLQLHENSCD